eukprot:9270122-Pyramimonas_sp.AAC.1
MSCGMLRYIADVIQGVGLSAYYLMAKPCTFPCYYVDGVSGPLGAIAGRSWTMPEFSGHITAIWQHPRSKAWDRATSLKPRSFINDLHMPATLHATMTAQQCSRKPIEQFC